MWWKIFCWCSRSSAVAIFNNMIETDQIKPINRKKIGTKVIEPLTLFMGACYK